MQGRKRKAETNEIKKNENQKKKSNKPKTNFQKKINITDKPLARQKK